MIHAVVFDLDGVLVDSEPLWDAARRTVAADHGGRWQDEASATMQGMSSVEWSRYMRGTLGVDLAEERIVELVVARLLDRYAQHLPLLPGAVEAVERLSARWPLGVASSSNRVVIDAVLEAAGMRDRFAATVSSEEVRRGKPHPDVYRETAGRLGQAADRCAAVEDSANGIRAAVAAGMRVVAVPNRQDPPPEGVLATADLVVAGLDELTVEAVAG